MMIRLHVLLASLFLAFNAAQAAPTVSQSLRASVDTAPYTHRDGSLDRCADSALARTLAEMIINDPQQQRPRLRCDGLLAQLAAERARELAEAGEIRHFRGVRSPNMILREGGYPLPPHYPTVFSNQVEALAGGYAQPEQVWQLFKESSAHRSHLLGEHPFYAEQDEIGVGFYRLDDSPHVEYWVVLVAKRDASTADEGRYSVEQCGLHGQRQAGSPACQTQDKLGSR